MSELGNEDHGQSYNQPWEGDSTGSEQQGSDATDKHYDSQIIPMGEGQDDTDWHPAWMDTDFTYASFADVLESRDIPYGFGIRQFDGIEPRPEEMADNARDFYNTESEVLHMFSSFSDRRVYAGASDQDYDDTLPVLSYQHLELATSTEDGKIKITIDGSQGLMVDFYGADGSVSHNRYFTSRADEVSGDEVIYVDRSNRDHLLASVPPPGVTSEADRQQMINDLEARRDASGTLKDRPYALASREELKHVLQLTTEATPAAVSFYDLLQAADNRAESGCAITMAANEYAAQSLTDDIDAFLKSFGLPAGADESGASRFQQKTIGDGSGMSMVVKCGYTKAGKDRPSQPAGHVTLSEPLNQEQLHNRLSNDTTNTAARYPSGGRAEKKILMSTIRGRLAGIVIENLYGANKSEPLYTAHTTFIPDATHTQLFSKITQDPHIFNQTTGE